MKTKDLVLQAMIAGVYIAITVAFKPISYGMMQIRVSEVMLLLVLINPKWSFGLIIGCLLANFASDAGMLDVIFGTLATAITVGLMSISKDNYVALIWPALINGVVVGAMLGYVLQIPYLPTMGWVFIGEFIATMIPGILFMKQIRKYQELQQSNS